MFGGVWPALKGSMMRYCAMKALKGVAALDLRRDVERPLWNRPEEQAEDPHCGCGNQTGECKVHGVSWKRMLGWLRRDPRSLPGKYLARAKHTWKLSEEGGILKLYDIRLINS